MPSNKFDGFVGQSYTLRNYTYDAQRTVNLFPAANETGRGKQAEIAQLERTPGLVKLATPAWLTVTRPAGLGIYTASTGTTYIALTTGLYTTTGTTLTQVKAWDQPTATFAKMLDNMVTLFIVGSGWGYTYNMTTGALTEITAFTPGGGLTFLDGYVIVNEQGTNKFWHTELYADTFPGLNYYYAEANQDNIVAVFNNNDDLWILGTNTTEVWYNAGQGNTILARRPGILLEIGCAAPGTVAKLDNNRIAFLANSDRGQLQVVIIEGYAFNRISTFAIDQKLAQADYAAATAYSFAIEGHMLYCLNVPGLDTTLVFDATTSAQLQAPTWHERAYTNPLTGRLEQHRAAGITFDNGTHLGVDRTDGSLLELTYDAYDDFGSPIRRIRTSPHISNNGGRVFYGSLEVYLKMGRGTLAVPNPTVMLEMSNDGGATWGNALERSAGAMGIYNNRVIFRQLGQARDRVFRVTMSDPIDWAVVGAALNITGSNE